MQSLFNNRTGSPPLRRTCQPAGVTGLAITYAHASTVTFSVCNHLDHPPADLQNLYLNYHVFTEYTSQPAAASRSTTSRSGLQRPPSHHYDNGDSAGREDLCLSRWIPASPAALTSQLARPCSVTVRQPNATTSAMALTSGQTSSICTVPASVQLCPGIFICLDATNNSCTALWSPSNCRMTTTVRQLKQPTTGYRKTNSVCPLQCYHHI